MSHMSRSGFSGDRSGGRADLKPLSALPLDARDAAWRKLLAIPAKARAEGWSEWELDEAVFAHARSQGILLTPAQNRWIITHGR